MSQRIDKKFHRAKAVSSYFPSPRLLRVTVVTEPTCFLIQHPGHYSQLPVTNSLLKFSTCCEHAKHGVLKVST